MKRNYLLVFLLSALLASCCLVFAEEADEEEDADVEVEASEPAEVEDNDDDEYDGGDVGPLQASPDVETSILFLKPYMTVDDNIELPAGKHVEILVGFHNKGEKDFTLTSLEGSLRYPMDFNFYMQNFSTLYIEDYVVPPGRQGSVLYEFTPAEAFGSRSFGLTIGLSYLNQDGVAYVGSAFNKTVPIVEVDDGLDGETFFLYLFLIGLVVLAGIMAQQFFLWGKRKAVGSGKVGGGGLGLGGGGGGGGGGSGSGSGSGRHARRTQSVEMGTKSDDDNIDYDWLPKETLRGLDKTQKKAGKNSKTKRSRKNVRGDGSLSN